MSASIDVAYSEIFGALRVAWDASPFAGGANPPLPLLWPNREASKPAGDDAGSNPLGYGKVFIQHTFSGDQATLVDSSMGKVRYRSTGVATVQLFVAKASGKLWTDLVKVVQTAWRGVTTASGVIFRNVTPTEGEVTGSYFQVNVNATFEYDEIA